MTRKGAKEREREAETSESTEAGEATDAEVDDSALERVSGGLRDGRAAWFLPEVDDEVVVSFERGRSRQPVVLGQLWNGKDEPPE